MVRDDEHYLIFDFGGGTLDVSVVRVSLDPGDDTRPRPVILGRAGEEIGGGLVDRWMLEDLRRRGVVEPQDVDAIGSRLVQTLEDAKIALSCGLEETDIAEFNDQTGRLISHTLTRSDLAGLLAAKHFDRLVSGTILRAMESAQKKYGFLPSDIRAALMVGGSSLLLGVENIVRTLLPEAQIHCERPFEAIAAGACRYAGEDLNPTLVHEYGIYSWNHRTMEYEWVPVIPRGTRYPTEKPVSGRYITTANPRSDVLGLVVVERSEMKMPRAQYEVGSDGRLRVASRDELFVSGERELNPEGREFIHAVPACTRNETNRFLVGFGVDRHKRLTVSIKDTRPENKSYVRSSAGQEVPLPVRNFPLVKL
jgi:molecular chaperone DnaK (HSP70)